MKPVTHITVRASDVREALDALYEYEPGWRHIAFFKRLRKEVEADARGRALNERSPA